MFNNLGTRINDIHIKKKILFLFLFGILLPIVILVTFFTNQIKTELSHREETLVESELTRIQLNIASIIDTANNLASTYFSDKDMAWALETYKEDSKESLGVIRKVDSQILSNQMLHPYISQINIYFENTDLFETIYAHLLDSDTKQTDWYKEFIASQQSTYLSCLNQNNSMIVYLIRRLNLLHNDSDDFIKIDLSSEIIRSYFASELLSKEKSDIYLVNSNNQIVISNNSNAPKMFGDLNITSDNQLYEKTFDDTSLLKGWKIKVVSTQSILYLTLNNELLFLMITFLLIIFISMLMFFGLAHSIISRLEYIAKIMDQSKNDELTIIDIDMGSDEIGITALCYNNMIHRIQSLIEENAVANDELQTTNEELSASLEEIKSQEKQIDDLIYIDKLTNLDNRFAITRFIDNQILEMSASGNLSIGFLDLDNFKFINDTYGHDTGDEIINQTGLRLKGFESDIIHIGRFGGDEFIITVKDFKDLNHLNHIHESIRLTLREPITINNISFLMTISIGVSLYPIHSKNRHELIKLADIALYKAKEQGRDQIVLFENTMKQTLAEKLDRQAIIREAIRENQFLLYYQPFYKLKSHTLMGCEALLRWKDTCNLQMTPHEVILALEEMGLMIEFGDWILREACLFAKKLNENRLNPLIVSINISSLQLMHNKFVDKVLDIIETNQINIQHIALEMTESILMSSIEKGATFINRLREAGISISLDDFGTGYSSLKYFKELPITTLKIDKSFIDQIATNEYDKQLVETMIQLAHNKKIQVIAEGVEAQDQLIKLSDMNCDMIQGFLFSKPIAETQMVLLS